MWQSYSNYRNNKFKSYTEHINYNNINSKIHENITTYIDFSNCEKRLRQKNELSESSVLTLYQIEIDNTNQQSLINHVEYAVFNENKEKLDLSICENEFIEINYQLNTKLKHLITAKFESLKVSLIIWSNRGGGNSILTSFLILHLHETV